ncbi:hypothetical protein D6D00_02935 [Aureobasidium pullulans]|nr:hypothetical protein D6D00_02935 [Aureobasidium pullulans]
MATNMPEDKGFVSGANADPSAFNNPQDSDIILKVGETQFYAHRVVLRMWSPFFKRALNSQFSVRLNWKRETVASQLVVYLSPTVPKPETIAESLLIRLDRVLTRIFYQVAKSAVFNLGEDDIPEHVEEMLKYMYGLPHEPVIPSQIALLKRHISMYMLVDKYDCPSMRIVILKTIKELLESSWEFSITPKLPEAMAATIATVCGPEAPQLADPGLRAVMLEWTCRNFSACMYYSGFSQVVDKGSMLDSKSFSRLIARICQDARYSKQPNKLIN